MRSLLFIFVVALWLGPLPTYETYISFTGQLLVKRIWTIRAYPLRNLRREKS